MNSLWGSRVDETWLEILENCRGEKISSAQIEEYGELYDYLELQDRDFDSDDEYGILDSWSDHHPAPLSAVGDGGSCLNH